MLLWPQLLASGQKDRHQVEGEGRRDWHTLLCGPHHRAARLHEEDRKEGGEGGQGAMEEAGQWVVFRAVICVTLALTRVVAEEALPVLPSLRCHQIKVEASLHIS